MCKSAKIASNNYTQIIILTIYITLSNAYLYFINRLISNPTILPCSAEMTVNT